MAYGNFYYVLSPNTGYSKPRQCIFAVGNGLPMNEQEYMYFLSIARAVGYSLMLSLSPSGVDILYTKELSKGNYNPHALLHIIPRFEEDKVAYLWEPVKFDDATLTETATTIRGVIESIKNEGVNQSSPAQDKPAQKAAEQNEIPPKKEPPADKDKIKEINRKPVVF